MGSYIRHSPKDNFIGKAQDISSIRKIRWQPHHCFHYRALSIYRGHFSLNNSRKTTHISRESEKWGVVRECKAWPNFYHRYFCAIRTIVLWRTAIYRESIVFSYFLRPASTERAPLPSSMTCPSVCNDHLIAVVALVPGWDQYLVAHPLYEGFFIGYSNSMVRFMANEISTFSPCHDPAQCKILQRWPCHRVWSRTNRPLTNENIWFSVQLSLKFVQKGPIDIK